MPDRKRIGVGPNYTVFENTGFTEANGDAQAWDDMRIVPGAFTFPGSADPVLRDWQPGGSGPIFKVYCFDVGDFIVVEAQVPHTYVEGTNIEAHVHWTPRDRGVIENAKTVNWQWDITWCNANSIFAPGSVINTPGTCGGVDDKHEVSIDHGITGTVKKISSIVVANFRRASGDTWVGTGVNAPALLEIDFHFKVNTKGSRARYVK